MLRGWVEIVAFFAVAFACAPALGGYMAAVFAGRRALLTPVLGPLERLAYRALRVDPGRSQGWRSYAGSLLAFSAVSWLALYAILRSQAIHPFNPSGFPAVGWDLSFNTASSFVTNTNWQFYGGESTLSYFSQMAGLAAQNFVSAAVGLAVAIALIRAIASRRAGEEGLGCFYADLVRGLLYVLLPVSLVAAIALLSQGVVQTLGGPVAFTGVGGAAGTIARGPVASQEAIKMLGTNGGGFFNVNSAMPFENPTALSNWIEMLLMLLIPASLTFTYGRMVGSRRQGWAIFAAMFALLAVSVAIVYVAESHPTTAQQLAGVTGPGNLEGKELRNGIAGSSLFTALTTAISCGAVNSALESLTGWGGLVPMLNLSYSESAFGGIGAGLYTMLLYVLLAVFVGGLMVGRTPEYLGKRIEPRDIKLISLAVLVTPLLVLALAAFALASGLGRPSMSTGGPQGFGENLYAYLSQANNNGSALAGYAGGPFTDVAGGLAMLLGRFVPIVLVLAVAGSFARKRATPPGRGTLRTDTPTFVGLNAFVVVVVGALTFLPALLLGPIVLGLNGRLL